MKILAHCPYVGTTGYNSHSQNFFTKLNDFHEVKVRNFTVGKNWEGLSERPHDKDVERPELMGIQSLWNGSGALEDFEIYGFKKENFSPELNIILAEVEHHYFYQNYSGPKIAYTVWEATKYPNNFLEKLKEFDQVWVPSEWQAKITAEQGIDPNKIKIVPEGVDTETFKPENKAPEGPFRFLLFGRWDDRKATKEIIQCFKEVFGGSKNIELILSVDNPYAVDSLHSTEERLSYYNLEAPNIKVLHFLPRQDYINYLKGGHVFLSCSRSEGWNLPLIEAMACGTPVIYSDCSGQLEFAKGKGIPVKIKEEVAVSKFQCSFVNNKNQEAGNWYEPDFEDLRSKILDVYNNYQYYKDKALTDSKEIRDQFTWENAARKACAAIDELPKTRIKYLGVTESKRGIYYTSTSPSDTEVEVSITDGFTGLTFYLQKLTINSHCRFFTEHASVLPNQIFTITDPKSGQVLLRQAINTDLPNKYDSKDQNLVQFLTDKYKRNHGIGFSYCEIFNQKVYSYGDCDVEEGDIVFDIGACSGLFSRFALRKGAKEVHAFEANPGLRESCLNLNPNENFKLTSAPVYSKPVKVNPTYGLLDTEVTLAEDGINVDINTYIKENNIPRIDYLKVDIEGAEYDLFEHIDKDYLKNNVQKIALEYHHSNPEKLKPILKVLFEAGFVYEFREGSDISSDLGMLYAHKPKNEASRIKYQTELLLSKYRPYLEKSGKSRLKFYEYIVPKLLSLKRPITILETGTMWVELEKNMGAFTLIMADLIANYTGGRLYTVDISQESLNKCKVNTKQFSNLIEYVQSDSVSYLKNCTDDFIASLDLVYLDSWDYSLPDPHPSANHHLQELLAIYDRLATSCPIAIDDNFLPNTYVIWEWYNPDGSVKSTERFETGNGILGKGQYCHSFLIERGWKRNTSFDFHGENNLFFYEREKLSLEDVKKTLRDFYSKNAIVKPITDKFQSIKNIANNVSGLGDAIILSNLTEFKKIKSLFPEFKQLMGFNQYYEEAEATDFFDINSSDWSSFDWGGGHCIQRLEAAFLGKRSDIPKPYINKTYNPISHKVALHFKTTSAANSVNNIDENIVAEIKKYLKLIDFKVVDCSEIDNVTDLVNELSTCEFFIGIDSGPMHVAAALGLKSVILLNREDSDKIYLPKMAEADIPNSEWLYPQNVHLSLKNRNPLIEKFSIQNLARALNGWLYPYFSKAYCYLSFGPIEKWKFIYDENKLEFTLEDTFDNARIVLKELTTNLKCYDWEGDFKAGVDYFIIPTQNVKLMYTNFSGFTFSLYQKDKLLFTKEMRVKVSPQHIKFQSNLEDDLSIKDSFFTQYVDFQKSDYLRTLIAPGDVVIDVGASCGTFTSYCLDHGASKVIAIEPSKSYSILSKTFKDDNRVISLNRALSTDNLFKLISETDHTTLSSFDIASQVKNDSAGLINGHKQVLVKCSTLEFLYREFNLPNIDLLKMDIEGHEYEIFAAINPETLKPIKKVLIEYHHNEENRAQIIVEALKKTGFYVELLDLAYNKTDTLSSQGIIAGYKQVNIINDSGSLGDAIAWTPMVDLFQQKHSCKVDFYTPLKELFEEAYSNINFHNYSRNVQGKAIKIAYDQNKHKKIGLQEVAAQCLGLEEKSSQIKKLYRAQSPSEKKTVCIAIQSTSQCKYWNNPTGWQQTVDYLISLGYDVVCIDRDSSFGIPGHFNLIPKGVVNKTGNRPLKNRMQDISKADFFIGLSSGLAWLAWACHKPVIMISGFTKPYNEFETPYRVINESVCNGCWHEEKFDPKNWLWCPKNKNFECSRAISFEMVKKKIDECLLK